MKYRLLPILILFISCNSGNNAMEYMIVYKSDKEGNTIMGNKQALIQHIRGGSDIKIGWGNKGKTHSIEHLSVPIWVSVLDGSEVIVHLDPQILSKIDWDNLSANYADHQLLYQEWRVVITTKGEFDAIWYDRRYDSIIRHYPQRHTMTWYAKGGTSNIPFFEENEEY